ncbi:fluG protein [Uncinocarpus reesii 1704]|uniref:FluG protein n=1 Tax=Uncinocarpus reesii (strain UAMH 1704) TaxID=336963 RepID=C4JDZ6_UNCRE|nr:fluG protein [Uncinocarpus reesii 1704]EEP75574.1 fluG protein [Uncinocarpus reesii 1704]
MADVRRLRHLIYNYPIIDNHAHNILSQESATDYSRYPLEAVTSEAQGKALIDDVTKSLSHHRAVNQLAELYGCEPKWEAIKLARQKAIEEDYSGLVKRCLEGTHMLLIDDGLVSGDDVKGYSWHDEYTNSTTRRVVRIEAVAKEQIERLAEGIQAQFPKDVARLKESVSESGWFIDRCFDELELRFMDIIHEALDDPIVAGFKSVICYRTGLKDIKAHSREKIVSQFIPHLRTALDGGGARIQGKYLNDHIVTMTLDCIQEKLTQTGVGKPIQFHTGLGDADINLVLSNPAHLQSLVESYSTVEFVLLHSSYPFTREAGYLASMYKNVHLDIGEVFPMVNRDGQLSILRQSLELVPTSKILWSTDGHFHPETFWLANKQFREIMDAVLLEYVAKKDLTIAQAMDAVKGILFDNSNQLYSLDQTAEYHPGDSFQTTIRSPMTPSQNTPTLDRFLEINSHVEFIWAILLDYTATARVRMFPIREFAKIVKGERKVGITLAILNMIQNDTAVPPGPLIAGQLYLKFDLSTLSINAGIASKSATVMTFWETEDGKPQEGCPRTILQTIANKCETEFEVKLLCGFEIEVVFMEKSNSDSGPTVYKPWLRNHFWSNMTSDTRRALPLIEDIVSELAKINVFIEQFHTESGPGQFEFILPPASPLEAVDTLFKARQTIVHLAERQGLRATLYPRPFAFSAGTAAHVHISINPAAKETSFLAGLLHHLPAILPFTFPQDASYERVKEGIWAGGVWVAWGYQNRETPVRKICPGHWEVKSMDGLANPYLGAAAIIAGGYLGMKSGMELSIQDCRVDTATLSSSQRAELGIYTRMPESLDQALVALEADAQLRDVLGKGWVDRYIGVRRGEQAMLNKMSEEERKTWLIERY